MSVCVATIFRGAAGHVSVLCAADRTRSNESIVFEPPITKIKPSTNPIVVMGAGDENTIGELYNRTLEIVVAGIEAEPKEWWRVRQVAALWADEIGGRMARQERKAHAEARASAEQYVLKRIAEAQEASREQEYRPTEEPSVGQSTSAETPANLPPLAP
jgi:hypothetical protein